MRLDDGGVVLPPKELSRFQELRFGAGAVVFCFWTVVLRLGAVEAISVISGKLVVSSSVVPLEKISASHRSLRGGRER